MNYIEHLHVAISAITGCVSISTFASLVGIPVEIKSSVILLKVCAIIGGVRKNKSRIKKKKKKHDKKVLLTTSKLNRSFNL